MANAWSQEGREVWLVSTYLGERADGYPLHPGVSKVYLADSLHHKGGGGFTVLRKAQALRSLVRKIGPDVVVSFLTNVNILAILALMKLRIPLIVSERVDPAAEVELNRLLRWARAVLYPVADAIVVQTDAAARQYGLLLRSAARIDVIHNPLPRELDAWPVRARQKDRGGCVIAMGRLASQKGFAGLIKAYGEALGQDDSWRLQIWGDGPLRRELAALIDELHLEHCVRLCGPTGEPWTVLAEAQIFVLSSRYEGFPNALLEAMAVGLPCIACDCPSGPRELADGGAAAIIIPPDDVAKLAGALRDLAASRETRQLLGARAATSVRQRFAEHMAMRAWDQLIGQLLPPRDLAGGLTGVAK
jgi:glycosyltransferase involved in cell wall biosynthesis